MNPERLELYHLPLAENGGAYSIDGGKHWRSILPGWKIAKKSLADLGEAWWMNAIWQVQSVVFEKPLQPCPPVKSKPTDFARHIGNAVIAAAETGRPLDVELSNQEMPSVEMAICRQILQTVIKQEQR